MLGGLGYVLSKGEKDADELWKSAQAGAANRGLEYNPLTGKYQKPLAGEFTGDGYTVDEMARIHNTDNKFYQRADGVRDSEGITVRGTKDNSKKELSKSIAELDEEMQLAKSAAKDLRENTFFEIVKMGVTALPRMFGYLADNIVSAIENRNTIPEFISAGLDKKVVTLYKDLIKTESESLVENYENERMDLEDKIASYKKRLSDKNAPGKTDDILDFVDPTPRTGWENQTFRDEFENLNELENKLLRKTDDFRRQSNKLKEVNFLLNSSQLADNQWAIYGLLKDSGSSGLFSIHQKEAEKLQQFTVQYQKSKRSALFVWGSAAIYQSGADQSWEEYKELRGWK